MVTSAMGRLFKAVHETVPQLKTLCLMNMKMFVKVNFSFSSPGVSLEMDSLIGWKNRVGLDSNLSLSL